MKRSRRGRSLLADKIMIEYNEKKKYENYFKAKKEKELKEKNNNESSDK